MRTLPDREVHRFTRELGLTHAEFFRGLPAAIAHRPHALEGSRVRVEVDGRTVTIELGAQRHRTIAALRLPFLEATFTFLGFSAGEREAFMERFDLYFRRGGG